MLSGMIDWLRGHGAQPVEIDTDGIYFVPPPCRKAGELEAFREGLAHSLESGIEVEFDGEYVSMYSYKIKNYALLNSSGEMLIKGAALKSRGLEPFQRAFMREFIRLKLEGKDAEILALELGRKVPRRDQARAILDDMARSFVPDAISSWMATL